MRWALVAIVISMALSFGALVPQAHAITRQRVLKRANHWIKKRVKYSQSSYYRGYRRDCSGFVSMAWRLKRSYTSSTIHTKARRISWRSLRPGDAVRRPGHVEIFRKWKSKRHRTYIALEESTWGKPALRRVKHYASGCSALRYRHITKPKAKKHKKATPKPPVTPPSIVPLPSKDASGSMPPSTTVPAPSADATVSVAPSSASLAMVQLLPSAFISDSRA